MRLSLRGGRGCAEDAGSGQATGEGADEVEGVDLDAFAADALGELPAGGAVEHELEGLAVDVGPFGDDVGDEPAVVVGGELHRAADGRVDVDPMGPDVPGESDVEQVLERRPTDGRSERAAGGTAPAAACATGP